MTALAIPDGDAFSPTPSTVVRMWVEAGWLCIVTASGQRWHGGLTSGEWQDMGREPFAAAFHGCWCD